jgi:glycosyltransferase involved in cell wall biosynthesis
VIAGPDDGGFGRNVVQWSKKAGIAEKTLMTGLLLGDEKAALLADADVWVLPSYTENFGMALVEAMACGLPVVVSDKVNIHREIARAGAGLVVSCDAREVAAGIERLLRDRSLALSLGTAAQRLVASQFTWDRTASRLASLYQAVRCGIQVEEAVTI